MGDMGDFANAVRASSNRHKAMIAEKRAQALKRQLPTAVKIAEESNAQLINEDGFRYRLKLDNFTVLIYPELRSINQIEGKGLKLPHGKMVDNTGRGWIIDVVELIVATVKTKMERMSLNA